MTKTHALPGKLVTADQMSAAVAAFADSAFAIRANPASHLTPAMIVTASGAMYGLERSGVLNGAEVELPTAYTSADLLHFWNNEKFVALTSELIALLRLRDTKGPNGRIEQSIQVCRIVLVSLLHNDSAFAAVVQNRRRR